MFLCWLLDHKWETLGSITIQNEGPSSAKLEHCIRCGEYRFQLDANFEIKHDEQKKGSNCQCKNTSKTKAAAKPQKRSLPIQNNRKGGASKMS